MYCVRLMRQPNHPCGWCHRADRPRVIPGPFYLCCCCCCCGEPGSGTWHLVLPVAMPFHASTHPGTYTHTHTRTENRPPHAPRPAHVHIPDDGSAVAHAANDGPTRRPQLRPGPLCRRMASTGCHPQISSASIESRENADITGSEISPALISTTAVRKYVFEIYLLWKSMQ
jgi:hypothetical protein